MLASIALILVIVLFGLSRTPRQEGQTVALAPLKELPAWKPGAGWASAVPPERQEGESIQIPIYPPWTKEQGAILFPIGDREMFDPWCGTLYLPSQEFTFSFPDYPKKRLHIVVNSRSMREDKEPSAQKPLLRVLVAGDSHTDGVCENPESFPNLTERGLRQRAVAQARERGERFEAQSIEVLNAGKGGHSFYNYLGVLERHLDLQPDVLVVAVYGGNDFDDVLSAWHFYRTQGKRPPGVARYGKDIAAAQKIHNGCLSQAFSQVKYFDTNPDQKIVAIEAATEVMEQMQALCKERGIRLILLYIPPRQDVEAHNPQLQLGRLARALKLTKTGLASTNEMADGLLARMKARGIEAHDLRPSFAKAIEPLYWQSDWHINLAGHRTVAQALLEILSTRN